MKEKVVIEVETFHYTRDDIDRTRVSCFARNYGESHPCDTPDEIAHAIERCRTEIRRNGDIPLVDDKRTKTTLNQWFGGKP